MVDMYIHLNVGGVSLESGLHDLDSVNIRACSLLTIKTVNIHIVI